MGWRTPGGVFSYLTKRIVCRLAGTQFNTWGWPLTDLISEPGVTDYDAGTTIWRFVQPPPSPATRWIEARWILSGNAGFFLPYWFVQQSPASQWYGDDFSAYAPPMPWPKIQGTLKKVSTGAYDPLIAITLQRTAIWTDP
jgi:hypothetical protein